MAWPGWLLGRRRAGPPLAPGVGPHFLPEPALEWLRRSYGALGVWVAELDPQEEGPHAERIVDADRLSVAQIVAVDRRLERARDQEQSGAERMDSGTLVFHAAAGTAVGLLLPAGFDASGIGLVETDLRRLLDGVRRRPQAVALAQAQTQQASLESTGSVGLRLAYQLERALDAQVIVAATEAPGDQDRTSSLAPLPQVRVSASPAGATAACWTWWFPRSATSRAWPGARRRSSSMEGDPLGGVVADRRQRAGTVMLLPILVGRRGVRRGGHLASGRSRADRQPPWRS